MRTLYHASSYNFKPVVGEKLTLVPGSQAAKGVGVYFSEGSPDVRASDSCHLLHGMKWIFKVSVTDASRKNTVWYSSKGSTDRMKGRPKTWHTKGKKITLKVISVNQNMIECIAKPLH